jgi:hypothetical protein
VTTQDELEPFAELDTEAIFRALVEHDVEFLVIGGFAVAVHGYPRATKDVDIVPRPDPGNLKRLYTALSVIDARPLELADFRPEEMPVPFDESALAQGGNWVLRTAHGRVDVMQWIPGIDSGYDELDASAISVDLGGGGSVRVAGYEDVLAMKTVAGRPQDIEDIARLKQARGD